MPLALFAIASHLVYRAALLACLGALASERERRAAGLLGQSYMARIRNHSDSAIGTRPCSCSELVGAQEVVAQVTWSCVFHHFGGAGDFNPLVVFLQPLRLAKIYRFWSAFKDWKRGNREPVERLTHEFLRVSNLNKTS